MARHRFRTLGLVLLVAACGADTGTAAPASSPTPLLAVDPEAGDQPWLDATPTPAATPSPTPLAVYRGGAPTHYVVDALHAPPTPMPFRFQVPALNINVPMLNVGLDRTNAMSAPEGPLGSAYWNEAFWYRGGVLPGSPGTATIAGHLDDIAGRPAAFWRIRNVTAGTEVDVLDERTNTTMRFQVTETDTYSLAQASSGAVLGRIFGTQAAAGQPGGPGPDGLSHLTLITCTGTWTGFEYNHRFVAYAVRIG